MIVPLDRHSLKFLGADNPAQIPFVSSTEEEVVSLQEKLGLVANRP